MSAMRLVMALGMVLAGAGQALALDETMAHSVLKHDLFDNIAHTEQPTQIIDVYAGQIVYTDSRLVEVGAAGRIIMNGYTPDYTVNDMNYAKPPRQCQVAGLPHQVQPVKVQVTGSKFSDSQPQVATDINKYLSSIPRPKNGKRLVIVDPYYMIYQETVDALLRANPGDKFVFYSPSDRQVNFPLAGCNTFVFSETDENWNILYNSSRKPLSYSVSGCRLDNMRGAIDSSIGAFGPYLQGATDVQKCIVEGAGPFKK
jgi:hypothetical protein